MTPEQWQHILNPILDAVGIVLGALITLVMGWLMKKFRDNQHATNLIEALTIGIHHAEEAMVESAKKAAADGKLTADERQEAMRIAYNKALEIVSDPKAKAALKALTEDQLNSYIKRILSSEGK